MKKIITLSIAAIFYLYVCHATSKAEKLNILLITADDLNWDSLGIYGSKVKDTTPQLDDFARKSLRFERAHILTAGCVPSRNAIHSGRYPHNNVVGFNIMDNLNSLPDILRKNGYRIGVLGKAKHSSPYKTPWDMSYDGRDLGGGRNSQLYSQFAKKFISKSKAQGKPFYLMFNTHDPHRKWCNAEKIPKKHSIPTKTFESSEVIIPPFLADLPEVKKDLTHYYNSVRRMDDIIGSLLKILENSGLADKTIVIFLSDHGIAAPFAKANCYLHSTKTPLIISWPGLTKSNSIDKNHFINSIDIMPTLLEGLAIPLPEKQKIDGKSFLKVIKGGTDNRFSYVLTVYDEPINRRQYPMRALHAEKYLYIFNPWANGEREYKSASSNNPTANAMKESAGNNPKIAKRVKLMKYRVPEEFFDVENDPDCLKNLIKFPEFQEKIKKIRKKMHEVLQKNNDPALHAFQNLGNQPEIEKWIEKRLKISKKQGNISRQRKKKRNNKNL